MRTPLNPHSESHLKAHHRDFAAFAETMVQTHAGRFDSVFWSFLESNLPTRCTRVLDLGTGPGLLLADLEKRFSHFEQIWGVEAQPEMLKKAQSLLPHSSKLRLIEADLTSPLPALPSDHFDLAVCSMVLHELPHPIPLLRETLRCIKPGGIFILYDWIQHPLSLYLDGQLPDSIDEFNHFMEHTRLSAQDLDWLLSKVGFETLELLTRSEGRHALGAFRKPIAKP